MIKKNKISLIVLLILVLIAVWHFMNDKKNTMSGDESQIKIEDTASISVIKIINHDCTIKLEKQKVGWKLDEHYTPDRQLLDLCLKILTQIEIKSMVSGASMEQIADTLISSGSEIVVMNRDMEILNHIHIFANTFDHIIYIMQASSKKPYIVELPGNNGNFAGVFKANFKQWRSKTIISMLPNQINSIKVENYGNKAEGFNIQVVGNKKPVLTGMNNSEPLDYSIDAMKAYFYCFGMVKAVGFVEDEPKMADSLKKVIPLFSITTIGKNEISRRIDLFKLNEKGNTHPNFCLALINFKEVAIMKYIETDLITRRLDYFTK